jgi:hypothetical protein
LSECETVFVVVVVIVAMVVGEPPVAVDRVKHDFASFKIETEFQFPQARAAHFFS